MLSLRSAAHHEDVSEGEVEGDVILPRCLIDLIFLLHPPDLSTCSGARRSAESLLPGLK